MLKTKNIFNKYRLIMMISYSLVLSGHQSFAWLRVENRGCNGLEKKYKDLGIIRADNTIDDYDTLTSGQIKKIKEDSRDFKIIIDDIANRVVINKCQSRTIPVSEVPQSGNDFSNSLKKLKSLDLKRKSKIAENIQSGGNQPPGIFNKPGSPNGVFLGQQRKKACSNSIYGQIGLTGSSAKPFLRSEDEDQCRRKELQRQREQAEDQVNQ